MFPLWHVIDIIYVNGAWSDDALDALPNVGLMLNQRQRHWLSSNQTLVESTESLIPNDLHNTNGPLKLFSYTQMYIIPFSPFHGATYVVQIGHSDTG